MDTEGLRLGSVLKVEGKAYVVRGITKHLGRGAAWHLQLEMQDLDSMNREAEVALKEGAALWELHKKEAHNAPQTE